MAHRESRQGGTRPWGWLGALLLSLTACASSKPHPIYLLTHDEADVLVSTNRMSDRPFTVLQRIRGKHGTADVAFECVLELSPDKLKLEGMTTHAAPALVAEQVGLDVLSHRFTSRDVPFEPTQLLYDIHRIFFRGLPAPQTDGTHEWQDHGEVVREQWKGGHLVERSFHALDTFARLLVLSFEGPPAPVIASRVRLTNLHYGYSFELESIEQRRVESVYTLDVAEAERGSARLPSLSGASRSVSSLSR